MDVSLIKKQAVKFNQARGALLSVCVLTAINLVLMALDSGFTFIYSASVPQLVYIFIAYGTGNVGLGMAVAMAMTAVYVVCWGLSKRWRAFMLVALILFSIDTLLLLLFSLLAFLGGDVMLLVQIAFAIWITIKLIGGTVAWAKLRHVSPEELMAAEQAVSQAEEKQEAQTALNEIMPASAPRDDAPPTPLPNPDEVRYIREETAFPVDDALKQNIIEVYKSGNKVDTLYLFEDIDPQKLESAMKSYAPSLAQDEMVFLHFDNTVGSAKEGFILTSKRLYSKNSFQKDNEVYLAKIDEVIWKQEKNTHSVVVEIDTKADMEIQVTYGDKTKRAEKAEALAIC